MTLLELAIEFNELHGFQTDLGYQKISLAYTEKLILITYWGVYLHR
jgi:hypothetical protein